MTKEMFVSSTPHETKVAINEDDQLAEIFFERENEYTLAGSIYKGRVTRVLPGMQSAFVDIGLERDAFLYVSDFLDLGDEDEEEFEQVPTRPETYVTNKPQPEPKTYEFQKEFQKSPKAAAEPEEREELTGQGGRTGDEAEDASDQNGRSYRGRRRRRGRRGRGFPESKFARSEEEDDREEPSVAEDFGPAPGYGPIVLPGESISKYRRQDESARGASEEGASAEAPAQFVIEGGFDEESVPAVEQDSTEKQPAEPESPRVDFVRPAPQSPIVLPGESIAKYRQTEAEEVEEKAEGESTTSPSPSVPEAAATPAAEVPEQTATGRQRASSYPPIVLPGESIAKYRQRAAPAETEEAAQAGAAATHPEPAEEADQESNEAREQRSRKPRNEGPRTEVRMERRSPVAPFILPGESIAKYRRVAVPEPEEERHAEELQQEIDRQPEEELAREAAEMVENNEPLAVTLEKQIEAEVEAPEPMVSEHEAVGEVTEPTVEAEPEVVEETETKSEEPIPAGEPQFVQDDDLEQTSEGSGEQDVEARFVEPETASRYENMNVAATFGGDATEEEAPELEALEHLHDEEQTLEQRHGYSAEAGHTLESEEIDEEEAEYRLPEEDEEPGEYFDVEEETYERGMPRREDRGTAEIDDANGLTDTVEDAIIDEETTESAYPADASIDDNGVEIETPEELAEEEFEESELELEGSPSAAVGHAAPSGAYPHRRPDFDRRGQRGRRGGRHMRPRREHPRAIPQISDLLKEGQEVLIQIAKEPIGKKGARITSHIALPGRYLVYMPTVNHIGVSRKIASEEERHRLKRIMISEREGGHGGFIVRTAAEGITEEDLRADIRFLKNLWAEIRQRSDNSKAPALIYHDLNVVERVLRDQVTADFSAIWVDNEQEYERILRFSNRFQPQLVRKVKLYTKSTPLFEQFGIQEEINKALKSKVWLKSGGYIVINQTEALVAIDVNTGKYVGKTARLEDTIVKTNVDAIREIVRQIRLRDLGGIIVVDFIDMDERKNRQKVMQALEEAMKADRAPSKVLSFNDFGLVAITRKRVKQSLERTLGEPCPYCTGTGLVKSMNTMCNEIYVEMRKMARHVDREDVVLRVNPEVAKALKAEGGKWLQDMEEVTRKTIIIKSDPLLHQEHFDIEG